MEVYGTYEEISNINLSSLNLMSLRDQSNEEDEYGEDFENNEAKIEQTKAIANDLMSKQAASKRELQTVGSVNFRTYFLYLTAGGNLSGIFSLILVIIIIIGAQTFMIMTDFWLSTWSTNEENFSINNNRIMKCMLNFNSSADCLSIMTLTDSTIISIKSIDKIYPERTRYYNTYALLAMGSFLLVLIKSIFFFLISVRASKKIYEKLFKSVINTYIKFFELNPIGRIINRFVKNTNDMDGIICYNMYEFFYFITIVFSSIIVPIIINYFVIIPLVPALIVFELIRNYYIGPSRKLKRLENIAKSSILVHANDTVEGISTARCFGKEDILCKEFEYHTNNHTRACYAFLMTYRCYVLRLDMLYSIFVTVTLFISVFIKGLFTIFMTLY